MRVGSIFIWKEFDRQADKRIKDRLFIYFGRSPAFIEPIYAYIATTTGKTEYYKNGGRFSNSNIVWFKEANVILMKIVFWIWIGISLVNLN